MSNGKPTGVRFIQLTKDLSCNIFDVQERPEVCSGFKEKKLFVKILLREHIKLLFRLKVLKFNHIIALCLN